MVERRERPLRRRVESADRFHDVAVELESYRLTLGRRVDMPDTAADAELAVAVHRIFGCEARGGEPFGDVPGRDLRADADREAGVAEPAGVAQPRQERTRGQDDDTRVASGERMERARPRRRNLEVRAQPAVWINFL